MAASSTASSAGHLAVDGPANGPLTMGYYTRADLDFYYALADAFTICDHYHCSVIGPTDPNRLYSMAGSLDPAGKAGGPILSTSGTRVDRFGTLTYTTMPERRRAGRSPAARHRHHRGGAGCSVSCCERYARLPRASRPSSTACSGAVERPGTLVVALRLRRRAALRSLLRSRPQ